MSSVLASYHIPVPTPLGPCFLELHAPDFQVAAGCHERRGATIPIEVVVAHAREPGADSLEECGGHTRKDKKPPDGGKDGPEHGWRGVGRLRSRDEVGAGHGQPCHPQRAAAREEAPRDRAHTAAARYGPGRR